MNICIIGNEDNTVNWEQELKDKDIIVRVYPNTFDQLYDDSLFTKEHHAILNGNYSNETNFDLIPDEIEFLKKYNKILFMNINKEKNLLRLVDVFYIHSIRHLANDHPFKEYIKQMEGRFDDIFSLHIKTLLYYCFTYKDDTIHTYKFGLKTKKLTKEKKFINSLYLNHISHD